MLYLTDLAPQLKHGLEVIWFDMPVLFLALAGVI